MKKFFSFLAVSFTLILGLSVSSCTTDLCKDVDCGTNGNCDAVDGKCVCNAGYELGTDAKCSKEMRAKFVGTWRGTDCGATSPHNIVITTNSGSITKVNISNYANSFCGASDLVAVGTLSTDGTKVESFTTDCTASTASIATTGNSMTLDAAGTTMTCNYKVTVLGTDYTCTLTYTKQ